MVCFLVFSKSHPVSVRKMVLWIPSSGIQPYILASEVNRSWREKKTD